MTGRLTCLLGAAAVTALVLSGCSSDEDPAIRAAEAKVASKQRAVDDAEAQVTETSDEFCADSATYITAVDRYGDVLNATAPTVGDVVTAGDDLTKPAGNASDSAEAAVEAQQELASAEAELAAAEADLAATRKGQTPSPSASTTPTPVEPTTTVTRVEQAESEFSTARAGITDETPLIQASVQFNSAAVALEMAWLGLFADAGCLSDGQAETATKAVRDYTSALQQALDVAGYYSGEIDGIYGPDTVKAVQALQKAHGLPATGTVDKATDAALQSDLAAKGGVAVQKSLATTAAVQQTLKLAGFWDGPVDGVWTDALTDALKKFQKELGVEATGAVDAATITALEKAIAEAGEEEPAPTQAPSSAPTTTAPAAP